MIRFAVRSGIVLLTLALALAGAELAIRRIDGWPAWGRLPIAEHAVDEATTRASDRPDRQYVGRIALADGVSPDWYEQDPPAQPRIPMTPDIAARAAKYSAHIYEAFTVWNRDFLHLQVCSGVTDYGLGDLQDEYVFTPAEPGTYPIYRNLPSVSPPGWFVTNRFGWRGRDLDVNKDGKTIRIAFVGASTTVGAYYLPASYPEFVDAWLNRWLESQHIDARVEVINAARSGIDTDSIAAIVRQEVAPLEPDLVVHYEGANNFAPLSTIDVPERWKRERPRVTFRPPSEIEQVSALARRLTSFGVRFAATDGREPAKGVYPLVWPTGVDEQMPDPDAALPMHLDHVVRSLDSMRTATEAAGGEFALASFVWMVPEPRVPLDLTRHRDLYVYLNRTLWPASYAHVRRMADFQNRVFKAYAGERHTGYLDVAAAVPQDPDLFADPIHMGLPGLRLQAWIMLQQLVPWIRARIADGRLPKKMRTPLASHPAFAADPRRLVSISEVRAACPRPGQ